VRGVERLAGQEQLERVRVAQPRQADDRDHRRHEAEPHLAERERGVAPRDGQIARRDESDAARAHVSADTRDDRLRHLPHRREHPHERNVPAARLQVGAGAERGAGVRQHDDPHVLVVARGGETRGAAPPSAEPTGRCGSPASRA